MIQSAWSNDAGIRRTDPWVKGSLPSDCPVHVATVPFCPVVGASPFPSWPSGAVRFGRVVASAANDTQSFE